MNFDRVAAIIDFSSIKENYSLLCKTVHSQCKIMAVVKANAYGHGLLEVSRYLECIGVNYFAVASLSEAIELREGGINSNILILGHTNILKIKYIGEYNLIQTVATLQYAKDLNLSNIPINIHLKIDTGMSRYGFYCHDSYDVEKVFDEIKTVSSLSNLSIQGIFTHFADADNKDSGFTERQFALFIELTNKCLDEGIYIGLRHCSNSAAIIKFSKMNLDMVRAGIALYGFSPVETTLSFRPAMELKSVIQQINCLCERDVVGYGKTYKAKNKCRIATIPIGYADGYFRQLSGIDSVLVNGNRAPVVGRICMDACMIDITDIDAEVGDSVTIFGWDNKAFKSVTEIADLLGTINYEILCAVGNRVERIFV